MIEYAVLFKAGIGVGIQVKTSFFHVLEKGAIWHLAAIPMLQSPRDRGGGFGWSCDGGEGWGREGRDAASQFQQMQLVLHSPRAAVEELWVRGTNLSNVWRSHMLMCTC